MQSGAAGFARAGQTSLVGNDASGGGEDQRPLISREGLNCRISLTRFARLFFVFDTNLPVWAGLPLRSADLCRGSRVSGPCCWSVWDDLNHQGAVAVANSVVSLRLSCRSISCLLPLDSLQLLWLSAPLNVPSAARPARRPPFICITVLSSATEIMQTFPNS